MSGLGEFIRKRRRQLGMSQKQLAEAIGMPRPYLSQVETSPNRWPQAYITALARALKVSEAELAKAGGKITDVETQTKLALESEDLVTTDIAALLRLAETVRFSSEAGAIIVEARCSWAELERFVLVVRTLYRLRHLEEYRDPPKLRPTGHYLVALFGLELYRTALGDEKTTITDMERRRRALVGGMRKMLESLPEGERQDPTNGYPWIRTNISGFS